MPYTLVHPGFSAWIKNKWLPWLSWNGIIFGSLVPDFDILFRLTDSRFHLINGGIIPVLLLLIPLTIILSLIFHAFIKNYLIDTFPEKFQILLLPFKSFNYINFLKQNYLKEILSVFLAIELHYLLDFISHWNAWYCMMAFHVLVYPSLLLKPFTYYLCWYFPQIAATALGFYFLYKYYFKNNISWLEVKQVIGNLKQQTKLYLLIFILNWLLFTILKLLLLGYESRSFAWHYIIIYATGGLIFSFFVTPLLMQGWMRLTFKKSNL